MAIVNLEVVRPKDRLFVNGETVSLKYTIKNTNEDKSVIASVFSQLHVRLTYDTETPITAAVWKTLSTPIAYGKTQEVQVVHRIDLSLKGNGTTGNGALSVEQYLRRNPDVRSLPVFFPQSNVQHIGRLLNTRYAPAISKFELQRADNGVANDEGEHLLSTVDLDAASDKLPVMLYCTQEPDVPKLQTTYEYPDVPLQANTWLGYEVSASSVRSSGDVDAAYNAFDGHDGNAWRSSSSASAPWIQIKLPRMLYNIRVSIKNSDESPAHGMTAGTIYGVDMDGTTLTQIGSFSGRDGATSGAESAVVCNNNDQAFRIVRVRATSWNGSSYAAVGEIKITGNRYPASDIPGSMQGIDLSANVAAMLNGISNSPDLITTQFSNGIGWNFLLVFGDEFEQATAAYNISRAFANLHLSGYPTGGACFGGFCTSTQDNPKLESYYPAHLYGGIAKIGNGWTPLTPVNGTTPATYGGGVLRCRKIEDKCIITGSVEVKPSSSTLVLADLPEGFVPAYNVFSLNACSGGRVARIAAYSNEEANTADTRGKLVLTWVKDLSDGDNYTSAAIWIQCSIEYWVDPPAEDVLLCGDAICGEAVCGKKL